MEKNIIKDKLEAILSFLKNRYFKFALAVVTYILWVIWLNNYWFLLGLPVIFDIYISKKVNWSFWKKRNGKNSAFIEWLDALIFAVIAVTLINIFLFQNYKIPTGSMEKSLLIGDHLFVSKVSFGPRIPNTPLSFPFAQHTMPLIKTKSYVEWIKFPYKRLPGLSTIKNDDIVVFNFPAGDTVVAENQAASYYSIVRSYALEFKRRDVEENNSILTEDEYYNIARNFVWKQYTVITRPMDRKDNYIKRCVAIPGDSLELKNGYVFINGKEQKKLDGIQFSYYLWTKGQRLNPKVLSRLGVYPEDQRRINEATYVVYLTEENAEKLRSFPSMEGVLKNETSPGTYSYNIFPHHPNYKWNLDNFGPLYIPKKGATIEINMDNIALYERIIDVFENNDFNIKDSTIYINKKPADTYTFKMNYYFMVGDNRHNSADSRMWGFVPEDHVVGRPKFIWLSIDKHKKFLGKIRLKRMFSVPK